MNVAGLDVTLAHQESPSTDRFYNLADLEILESDAYQDFREQLISLTGIRN